jgi:lipoate-protein ligase A
LSNSCYEAGAAPAELTTWQPKRLPYNSPEPLFAELNVYHECGAHSAAMNMAIDEALLERVTVPCIRFYRWQSPALSFGYFGKFADVARYETERDLVRRWTGGGIVFHGEDLTYSIVVPASDPAFAESSISLYEKIHHALAEALNITGKRAELATVAAVYDRRKPRKGDLQIAPAVDDCCSLESAVTDRRYSNCFANPVRADVMIDGRKIAGAAQRRTRRGLLQQGSIQGVGIASGLAERFAEALSANCTKRELDHEILSWARELTPQKYGTDSWLHKR